MSRMGADGGEAELSQAKSTEQKSLEPPEGLQGKEDVGHGAMRVYNQGTGPSL